MTCPCAQNAKKKLEQLLRPPSDLEWIPNEDERQDALRVLGNLPRGFYETDGGFDCGDADAAYVRGILLPTATYDAMPLDQRLLLQSYDVYPRWRLYGGPFKLKQDADAWDRYLTFWAFDQGQTWISHGTVCIVPPYVLAWPADSSVQWQWVNESQKPPRAQRVGQNVVWV